MRADDRLNEFFSACDPSLTGGLGGNPIGRAPATRETAAMAGPERERERTPATSVRWDLVRRVRREIAQGTYETAAKWDVVLDRILAAQGLGDGPAAGPAFGG